MRIATTIYSLILATSLFAQETKVFHINGILTSYTEAKANLVQINSILGTTYKDQNLTYVLAYNQTDGAISDILDVYNQKVAEYRRGNPMATDLQIVIFVSNITAALLHLPSTALTPAEVQTLEIDSIKKNIGGSVYTDADSEHIRTTIETNTTVGNNIFVVAHSQGTMYANIVYDKLMEDNKTATDKIKMLSVADVAAYMPNGDWLSSFLDPVIAGVKLFFSVADYNLFEANNTGHSLIDTYLKEGTTLLETFIVKSHTLLDSFTKDTQNGIIKFTFYEMAGENGYSKQDLPLIKAANGSLMWATNAMNYSTKKNDAIYTFNLLKNSDTNKTFTLDWMFIDVNATQGRIECGNVIKEINIARMATNHYGQAILTKSANGYDCTIDGTTARTPTLMPNASGF
ncbi:MAG: PE-PPE domain-containing protein [Sulfurimonas sp.]|jgi:hypothetical protein